MVQESQIFELEFYIADNGKAPLVEWLEELDIVTKAKVTTKLDNLSYGNFGNCKSVGSGLYELKIDFGPGYRVYYMKKKSKNFYSDYLFEELKNVEFATEYLNSALEENNEQSFLIAVRNIAQAHGIAMGGLAKKTRINRVNLYKMLSKKGNPLLVNVKAILGALGFKIAIVCTSSRRPRVA